MTTHNPFVLDDKNIQLINSINGSMPRDTMITGIAANHKGDVCVRVDFTQVVRNELYRMKNSKTLPETEFVITFVVQELVRSYTVNLSNHLTNPLRVVSVISDTNIDKLVSFGKNIRNLSRNLNPTELQKVLSKISLIDSDDPNELVIEVKNKDWDSPEIKAFLYKIGVL